MPRFVLLKHDWPVLHWDFMLEAGPVLRAWRLDALPEPGQVVAATASFDHRPQYLDYEGPVSGNRGTVRRVERGTFVWVQEEVDTLVLHLDGPRGKRQARLSRIGQEAWEMRIECL